MGHHNSFHFNLNIKFIFTRIQYELLLFGSVPVCQNTLFQCDFNLILKQCIHFTACYPSPSHLPGHSNTSTRFNSADSLGTVTLHPKWKTVYFRLCLHLYTCIMACVRWWDQLLPRVTTHLMSGIYLRFVLNSVFLYFSVPTIFLSY